jgi:hypothetical protein
VRVERVVVKKPVIQTKREEVIIKQYHHRLVPHFVTKEIPK